MGADKEQSNPRSRIKPKNQNQPRGTDVQANLRFSGESPIFHRTSRVLDTNESHLLHTTKWYPRSSTFRSADVPRGVYCLWVLLAVCAEDTAYIVPVCKLDPFPLILVYVSHPAVFVSSGCVVSFVPAACVRPAASLNSTHYRTPWHPVPWERIERLREDKPSLDHHRDSALRRSSPPF